MDRNEKARREFEAGRQRQEFARAVSSGMAGALDRFGRRIEVGQHVLFHAPVDYVYKVIDVAPVLAPNAPPGLLRVVMAATITASVHVNMPEISMIALGALPSGEEQQPASEPAPTAEVTEEPSRGPTVIE